MGGALMDPDVNIIAQRMLAKRLLRVVDDGSSIDRADVALLCELVEGLDQWMCKGGFLPKSWELNRGAK